MIKLKKRNLFLVLNPFQLICAQEARELFCAGEFNHLVIVDRNGPGSLEYQQKINQLDESWSKVSHLIEAKKSGTRRNLSRIKNTLFLAAFHGARRGKVFLGQPYLKWFQFIGNLLGKEVTFLDDGASSINFLPKMIKEGRLKSANETTPKLFSVFGSDRIAKVTNNAVMVNKLSYLRSKRINLQTVSKNEAIFIGQWLSESGLINQELEVKLLHRATLALEGYTVRYVRHRHESQSKLDEISRFMNVVAFDKPVEASLLAEENIPQLIFSWYSTALFTLNLLFPELKILALQLPLDSIDKQRAEGVRAVYDALLNADVTILRLDT